MVLGTGVSISGLVEELELLAESEVCRCGFGRVGFELCLGNPRLNWAFFGAGLLNAFTVVLRAVAPQQYRVLPCATRTHIFGPNFQAKKSFILIFKFNFLFTYI